MRENLASLNSPLVSRKLSENTCQTGIRTDPNPQSQPIRAIPSANQSYHANYAYQVLLLLYPKFCPTHNQPLTKSISTRAYSIRCSHPDCQHQQSRFSHTPLHHFKLPIWMFGWALHESIARYPQVLSASEIERRLGISKNSALLLKRRLQLFASDQMEKVKSLMQRELTEKFPDSASGETKLPPTAGDQHVSTVLGDRPVPQADSCVLYSASQRANQGRKRHKHTGQTASIYLANKLGGKQVGTLVHTLSWKGGPIIYDSIPNNQAQTLRPLLDKYIPKNVPLFTDEGYKFYYRINRNHRMVNHNRKSADPRYKWARNRWSINGIHNQVAEGNHRNLKYHFTAGYSYIRPEFSQLYLNEYAFWKSLKYYGWSKLIDQRLRDHLENSQTQRSAQEQVEQSSRSATGTKGSCGSTATTLTSDFPVQLQYPRPMKPYVRRTPNAKRKDNTARNEARIPQESTQEYSPQKTKTQNFVDNFKNPESSIDSRRALNLPSSNAIASQDAIAFPSREQNKYVLSSPIAVSANLSSGSSLSKVTGSNPAFRIIESEQVPTSATGSDSFAVSPDPTSLGFVSLRFCEILDSNQ
ncbi:transposase [Turneriella parva]|uniref:transposase n=1 Tax=Turneriella parva TaxID=29510 RepID=UPI0009FE0357|nr:transposase [Turneriella parva]